MHTVGVLYYYFPPLGSLTALLAILFWYVGRVPERPSVPTTSPACKTLFLIPKAFMAGDFLSELFVLSFLLFF